MRRSGGGSATRLDINRLEALIEKWSLQTLLLTERPRTLYRYRLPRLTALHQAGARLERTSVNPPGKRDGLTAVDEWDVRLVFGQPESDMDAAAREMLLRDLTTLGQSEHGPNRVTAILRKLTELGTPVSDDAGLRSEAPGSSNVSTPGGLTSGA